MPIIAGTHVLSGRPKVSKNSDNLAFLVSIVKNNYRKGEIDFEDFRSFLVRNKLSGFAYSIIHNARLKEAFPPAVMECLKYSYIEQWSRNELLLKEIGLLNEIFIKEGRDVIFMKGPFLAEHFYGDIGARMISDIDVLVKGREEIDNLDSVLAKNNFRRLSSDLINKKLTRYFTHHFEYKKKAINLDLHWALQSHFSFRLDYDKVWFSKRKISLNGKDIFILSDEYALVAILLSMFMDIQSGSLALKPFIDIYMILKKMDEKTDWAAFFKNRKTEGLFAISLNTLNLFMRLFECRADFKELDLYFMENERHNRRWDMGFMPTVANHSRRPIAPFRNKLWAFKLYDSSICKSLLWWASSLLFRISVYRSTNPRLLNRLLDFAF